MLSNTLEEDVNKHQQATYEPKMTRAKMKQVLAKEGSVRFKMKNSSLILPMVDSEGTVFSAMFFYKLQLSGCWISREPTQAKWMIAVQSPVSNDKDLVLIVCSIFARKQTTNSQLEFKWFDQNYTFILLAINMLWIVSLCNIELLERYQGANYYSRPRNFFCFCHWASLFGPERAGEPAYTLYKRHLIIFK